MREPRQTLFDRDLLYLFSYDVDLEMRREEVGFVPGGVRVNIFAKPNRTRMYNVARERALLGARAIQGTIKSGADFALIRSDDIGVLDVQLLMQTDDGATIFSRYSGLFPAGPRGFRQLISEKPPLGTEKKPFLAPVYITPKYETSAPEYSWLMQYQCAGFGHVTVINSTVRAGTFDIYAMDG